MGYKQVCFRCRKAFNRSFAADEARTAPCPQCAEPMTELYHLFKPPKSQSIKKWDVVEYLYNNGFRYYHLESTKGQANDNLSTERNAIGYYPENMREAKIFVNQRKNQ